MTEKKNQRKDTGCATRKLKIEIKTFFEKTRRKQTRLMLGLAV